LTTTAAPVWELRAISNTETATRWWLAIILLFAALYLGSAFSPALLDAADSTHAEAAREMLVSADYVSLHTFRSFNSALRSVLWPL